MRSNAEQKVCSNRCRQKRIYDLRQQQEKFDKMVTDKLEKGEGLCDDVLLEQSVLIDKLVLDEMLLYELKAKI